MPKKDIHITMSAEMAKLFRDLQGKDPQTATAKDKKKLARFMVLLKEQMDSGEGEQVVEE
jgi:hypothetical protein